MGGQGCPKYADISELFRREVLKAFVQQELIPEDVAQNMLCWPHSGFHVHIGPRIFPDEVERLKTTAQYAARAPLSLSRLHYDREDQTATYRYTSSYDHQDHIEQLSPLALIARLASHIPDHNERLVRYSGHYSNRSRGARRARAPAIENGAIDEEKPLPIQWKSQWQQLLRRVFGVTLTCPTCDTEMKVLAVITEEEPIHKILAHFKSKKIDPRGGPFAHKAA